MIQFPSVGIQCKPDGCVQIHIAPLLKFLVEYLLSQTCLSELFSFVVGRVIVFVKNRAVASPQFICSTEQPRSPPR